MKTNFIECLNAVLKHEGLFTADERDPGNKLPDGRKGSTMLGVTQMNWENHVGHQVTHDQMKALTPELVAPLYKAKYWDKVKGDDLPSGVDYVVFDAAVNSGPGRAAKWLQACVGVEQDGGIGPKTLAAVNGFNRYALIDDYAKRRLSFLMDLPHWNTFKGGWSKRVASVQDGAEEMVG
jgi:lysozyme family protein